MIEIINIGTEHPLPLFSGDMLRSVQIPAGIFLEHSAVIAGSKPVVQFSGQLTGRSCAIRTHAFFPSSASF